MSNSRDHRVLEPLALAALGRTSPQLFKLNLETVLARAEEDFSEATNQAIQASGWGEGSLDCQDLLEVVQEAQPVRLANLLADANPEMSFRDLARAQPLEVVKAVLKMLTLSDRYAAPIPPT